MDIEKVAVETPEKIITNKIELKGKINDEDIEKIIFTFKLNIEQKKQAFKLIKALYKILTQKDARLHNLHQLINSILIFQERIIMRILKILILLY